MNKKIKTLTSAIILASISEGVMAGVMFRQPVDGVEVGSPILSEEEVSYAEWYNYAVENDIGFTEDFSAFGINTNTLARSNFVEPLPTSPYPNKKPILIYLTSSNSSAMKDLSGLESIDEIQYLDILDEGGGLNNLNFLGDIYNYSSISINSPSLTDISGFSNIKAEAHDDSSISLYGNYSSANGLQNVGGASLFRLASPALNNIDALSSLKNVNSLNVGVYGTEINDFTPLSNLNVEEGNFINLNGISKYKGEKMSGDSTFCSGVNNIKEYVSDTKIEVVEEGVLKVCDFSNEEVWRKYADDNNIKYTDDFSRFGINENSEYTLNVRSHPPTVPYPNKNPDLLYLSYNNNGGELDLSGFDSVESVDNLLLYVLENGIEKSNYFNNLESYDKVVIWDNDLNDVSGLSKIVNSPSLQTGSLVVNGVYSDISVFNGIEDVNELYLISPNLKNVNPLSSMRSGRIRIGYPNSTIDDITPLSQLPVISGTAIGDITYYNGPKIPMESPLCKSVKTNYLYVMTGASGAGSYSSSSSIKYEDYFCE